MVDLGNGGFCWAPLRTVLDRFSIEIATDDRENEGKRGQIVQSLAVILVLRLGGI